MREEEMKALEGLTSTTITDDRAPLTSPVTLQIAFAIAAGYRFFASNSFIDATEHLKTGEFIRRVSWGFDGDHLVEWEGEEWKVKQFLARLTDAEWRNVRAKHPVARLGSLYALAADSPAPGRAEIIAERAESLPAELREIAKQAAHIYIGYRWKIQAGLDGVTEPHPVYKDPLERHLLIRQGKRRAYIRVNATPEERAADLKRYGMS